jgi:phosphate starvation-inducible PhoH-like protein
MQVTTILTVPIPGGFAEKDIFNDLDLIEDVLDTTFAAKVSLREGKFSIKIEEKYKDNVQRFFKLFFERKRTTKIMTKTQFVQMVDSITRDQSKPSSSVDIILKRKKVSAQTKGQAGLMDKIDQNVVTFALGVAGTGKSYLSVAKAVQSLEQGLVSRIVLTRPAVEAGENLGFLPGDLQAKIDPYLRPLYDALYDLLGVEEVQKLQEKSVIEVAPLAYMRGRTLNRAFVILDEAQNTTNAQMKMFLTRFGFGSKVVVNGDPSQIDLPDKVRSGLLMAKRILNNVENVAFAKLTRDDVVRHKVVQSIIDAYEKNNID